MCVYMTVTNKEVEKPFLPFGTIIGSLLSGIPQELSAVIDKHQHSGGE